MLPILPRNKMERRNDIRHFCPIRIKHWSSLNRYRPPFTYHDWNPFRSRSVSKGMLRCHHPQCCCDSFVTTASPFTTTRWRRPGITRSSKNCRGESELFTPRIPLSFWKRIPICVFKCKYLNLLPIISIGPKHSEFYIVCSRHVVWSILSWNSEMYEVSSCKDNIRDFNYSM